MNQNIEYFPSGETFVENHLNSYNTPYKFNAKELDDETGYYYYGARYYNPRVSLWLNVDPLASFDPIMNTEHYVDGQHNGGVYNSGNLNPYIYTYNSPIIYVDPNGKQADFNTMLNDLGNWIHDETEWGRKLYRAGNSIPEEKQKEYMSYTPLAPMITTGEMMERYNENGELPVQEIAEIIIISRVNKITSKLGIHANSKTSTRGQHGYVIFDKVKQVFVKVGVSASKEGRRMQRQIRRWNKEAGVERYVGKVVKKIEKGTENARGKIYDWERKVSEALENAGHLLDRDKHKRPRNKK